jgi:hypothetical protein
MAEYSGTDSLRRDESDDEKRRFWRVVDEAAARAPTVISRPSHSASRADKPESVRSSEAD